MAKAPRSLVGQVVAITGGARGIGRATATALIAQGARVAIGDIEADLAEQTAAQLGAGTVGLELDVTDRDSFAAFLDQIEARLGPLDVLINNAGIMPLGPFVEESEACSQRLVDVNLNGVINGSKLAIERFLPRRRGHLVQIASAAGKWGFAGGVTYCATKHAVVGLSEGLYHELRGTGIDISVVLPTVVNTELGSGLPPTRAFRAVQPEEVAEAIVQALQTGRFEVFVPRGLGVMARTGGLLPRRAQNAIFRLLRSDQVLTSPDRSARAAYEARMTQSIAAVRPRSASPRVVASSDGQPAPSAAEPPLPADPAPSAGEPPLATEEPTSVG
jgi:NAD(P)-dependent dehydrogenase (short-subunit alcohol dehydrogenase family)